MVWTPRTILLLLPFLLVLPLAASADSEVCQGGVAIPLPDGRVGCTHGPDPVPDTIPQTDLGLLPMSAPQVECTGTGTDGTRVQALYVVASDKENRSDEVVPQIGAWIGQVDDIFAESSGGTRVVRWVHDQSCVPVVKAVVVPPTGDDDFAATIAALADAGYSSPGRHYLAWVDATEYCGIAVNYGDDSPGQDNAHNGDYPLWGRVDRGCWGREGLVEAHELTHMLGAVQSSAPNATPYGHCTDEYDVMCYQDGADVTLRVACPGTGNDLRLDCNDDDYFDPDPAPGSYLDTHWNVARSRFLIEPAAEPPPPPEPEVDFADVADDKPFRDDIEWLARRGVTRGCNPPTNDHFCPDDLVTRGQMAAFLVRALGLEAAPDAGFTDTAGTTFATDIDRLAAAGITTGCGDRRFCPDSPVTRAQMAAFLHRGLP
jgi:hypothetical protein